MTAATESVTTMKGGPAVSCAAENAHKVQKGQTITFSIKAPAGLAATHSLRFKEIGSSHGF